MFAYPTDVLIHDFGAEAGWTQSYFRRMIGDVNGDGFNDIVGASSSGLFVSYGTPDGSFTATNTLSNGVFISPNYGTLQLADVNGDGRADLVSFAFDSVLLFTGQSDGTFASQGGTMFDFSVYYGKWTTQEATPRLLGDVNGDGKADILGFGSAGVWVSLATGGTGQNAFTNKVLALADFGWDQGWSDDNIYHRAVADVNGDGRADIVGFGQAGVWVSLSKGDGTFGEVTFALDNFGVEQGWSSKDAFPRVVGDVNGDGRADIVGFGIAGVYVSLAHSDGTFASPTLEIHDFTARQGWTSDSVFHRTLADINNDGQMDIVGFGSAGVLTALSESWPLVV